MSSTALDRCIVAVSLALAVCAAQASGIVPPRILQEPIFGLRLEVAKVKLDLLPDDVRNQCMEIADNENLTGRQWVYATARDAGATYYVVGGYFERRHPEQGESRYRLDTYGGVYRIDGTGCLGVGAAREVFNTPSFDETPQPILQQLAVDFAVRLVRAFGEPDRLRMKLRNQHVDPDSLSPELREAFSPYFGQ